MLKVLLGDGCGLSLPVLSVRSVLMRLNHAVFLLTIHLVLARNVLDLDTKWNFQKN